MMATQEAMIPDRIREAYKRNLAQANKALRATHSKLRSDDLGRVFSSARMKHLGRETPLVGRELIDAASQVHPPEHVFDVLKTEIELAAKTDEDRRNMLYLLTGDVSAFSADFDLANF